MRVLPTRVGPTDQRCDTHNLTPYINKLHRGSVSEFRLCETFSLEGVNNSPANCLEGEKSVARTNSRPMFGSFLRKLLTGQAAGRQLSRDSLENLRRIS